PSILYRYRVQRLCSRGGRAQAVPLPLEGENVQPAGGFAISPRSADVDPDLLAALNVRACPVDSPRATHTATADALEGPMEELTFRAHPATRDPAALAAAMAHLRGADPVLARLVAAVGSPALRHEPDYFVALVWSIMAQQISVTAATAIRTRLAAHFAPERPL